MKLISKLAALLALVTLGLTAAYFTAGPVGAAPGEGTCIDGATKINDPGDSLTINAPSGEVITQVAIKAGSSSSGFGCFLYPPLTSGPCYTVSGIGTATVTITRVGSGPNCKSISHVEYTTGPGTPPTTEPPPTTTAPTTTISTTTTP